MRPSSARGRHEASPERVSGRASRGGHLSKPLPNDGGRGFPRPPGTSHVLRCYWVLQRAPPAVEPVPLTSRIRPAGPFLYQVEPPCVAEMQYVLALELSTVTFAALPGS